MLFELQRSLLRPLLQCCLFIIWACLLWQSLAIWLWLCLLIGMAIGMIYFREQQRTLAMQRLDKEKWVIQSQINVLDSLFIRWIRSPAQVNIVTEQLILYQVYGIGWVVWCEFMSEQTHKIKRICITREQLSLSQWQKLQQLKNFL